MSDKSLVQRLLDAGYPAEEMYHHESDLYVYVTNKTTAVIREWCADNGFQIKLHCPMFVDQVTHLAMYDCAFQYTPFWEGKCKT